MSLEYFLLFCGVRSDTQTATNEPKNINTPDRIPPVDLVAENSGRTRWTTIYLSASLTVTVVLLSLIVMSAHMLKQRKFHTPCLQRRDAVSIVMAVHDTDQCKRISINTEIIAQSYRLYISRVCLNLTVLICKKP